LTSNAPVCSGSTLTMSVQNYTNATYSWFGPDGFVGSGNVQNRPNANSNFSGVYTVNISVPGCASVSRTRMVSVSPALSAVLGSNSPVCAGSSINLTTSTITGATYAWAGPNGYVS